MSSAAPERDGGPSRPARTKSVLERRNGWARRELFRRLMPKIVMCADLDFRGAAAKQNRGTRARMPPRARRPGALGPHPSLARHDAWAYATWAFQIEVSPA